MQPRRHGEALLRRSDRRLKKLAPRKPAMASVRQLQHAHHARNAHRAAADHCLGEVHGAAVASPEAIVPRGGRRGFAAVVAAQGTLVP
jgi:hypothetical protein